jgi:hypothetical protein
MSDRSKLLILFDEMVPRGGIEPPTLRFSVRMSRMPVDAQGRVFKQPKPARLPSAGRPGRNPVRGNPWVPVTTANPATDHRVRPKSDSAAPLLTQC